MQADSCHRSFIASGYEAYKYRGKSVRFTIIFCDFLDLTELSPSHSFTKLHTLFITAMDAFTTLALTTFTAPAGAQMNANYGDLVGHNPDPCSIF